MSLPSTPARSIARSPLSTPSSPRDGPSSPQLTPRSKVKAILAAVDDDSDSNSALAPVTEQPQRNALSTIDGNAKRNIARETRKLDGEEHDDASSEDSHVKPRGRGRVAARLNGQKEQDEGWGVREDVEATGDAYVRIKKQLLSELRQHAQEDATDTDTRQDEEDQTVARQPSPAPLETSTRLSSFPRSTQSIPRRRSRSSSSLFLTPTPVKKAVVPSEIPNESDASDDGLPANLLTDSRFQQLLARKKAEREAKEAAENKKRKQWRARQESFEHTLSQDATSNLNRSDEDGDTDRRLTQHNRPTRKAGRKALEEMSRETQRMSRNMQLAHQAKTKKKITKDSLFARFNFSLLATPTPEETQNHTSSATASPGRVSGPDDERHRETPPTSPLEPKAMDVHGEGQSHDQNQAMPEVAPAAVAENEEELPDLVDIMNAPIAILNKGKGKAIKEPEPLNAAEVQKRQKPGFTQRPIKIRMPEPSLRSKGLGADSESDLEVIPSRKSAVSKLDDFEYLPSDKVQDGRSLQNLRALAHLNSPKKQRKGDMSQTEMQYSLQKRARQQAMEERRAKIEDLKARGIVVRSAEEIEKDQAEVEDLLEKARREGDELAGKEKKAAKKKKMANGEADDLPDTDDEDDDYEEAGGEPSEVELSGSEEEEARSDEEVDGGSGVDEVVDNDDEDPIEETLAGDGQKTNGFIDDAASDDFRDEDEMAAADEIEEERPTVQPPRSRRSRIAIIEDDESDDEAPALMHKAESEQATTESAVEVPVFPLMPRSAGVNNIAMGMTQAFAATMAETQMEVDDDDAGEDSMALLGPPPEPQFFNFEVEESQQIIQDSQIGVQHSESDIAQETAASHQIDLHFSQSQICYDSLRESQGQPPTTQLSEIPDPTQDAGFVMSSPAPVRFASVPPSTVDTILLSEVVGKESPVVKKKGRLQRGIVVQPDDDEVNRSVNLAEDEAASANAFTSMKEKRKKAAEKEAFDKKKSEAKGMVEEQAQESEDEYAGLGGASDDESGGSEDEYVREIIDKGEVVVDEGKMAAFYANKERALDEKAVAKLFKDINNGTLRRKRGADFDLSDSDDDGEARRRRKRREFAKMRKALLENENVGKIAEDPKKLPFLRAIEDREDEEDWDFLANPVEDSFRLELPTQASPSQEHSHSQPQPTQPPPPLQPTPANKPPRPPHPSHRIPAPTKPTSLTDLRASLSFLSATPGHTHTHPPSSSPSASDSESPPNPSPNPQHPHPRRTAATTTIDRLAQKRLAASTSSSSTSRLAFHTTTNDGFKIPSLLRRATSSSLSSLNPDTIGGGQGISSTAAATERASGGGARGVVRRGRGGSVVVKRVRGGDVEGRGERRRRGEREREARGRWGELGGVVGGGGWE